jgi:two-component system phosphate regulon sensor histidine kinase PhoR
MSADKPEHWYRRVLDSMTDFVVVKDTRSRLIWVNQAFCDYYHKSLDELTLIVDADTSDPDDTAQYLSDDHKVLSEQKPLYIPHEAITDGHGNIRYYATEKTPLIDEDQLLGIVCVARLLREDAGIADFEKQREQWKAHLSELRTLVHGMPLAVAMLDMQMRFLAHSRAWHDLFAYRGSELVGQSYDELCERSIALEESIRQAIGEPRPVALEARLLTRPDGTQKIVNVEIRPWFTTAGDVGGSIVLLQDVTALQQANQKLRQLNDELLQFNYRVSHDLLAPLKTVLGYLNLCEEDLSDHRLGDLGFYHAKIRSNVTQLAGLVEDVLNLARSDALDAEQSDVPILGLLQAIEDKYQERIASASIALSVRCDVGLVRTERVRVQQILENLISNAIKYHDPAQQRRRVEVGVDIDASSTLVITVRDNGIGFEESQREAIFEIFKRGTSKHEGSGLGLYLVKKHLSHMRGQVRVLSCRNDTVFEVRIPIAPAAQAAS